MDWTFLSFQKNKDGYWRLHPMDTLLCNVYNIKAATEKTRVLKFNDNLSNIKKSEEPYRKNKQRLDWDCIPRSKPLAYVEAIHDLPNLKKTGRSIPSSFLI